METFNRQSFPNHLIEKHIMNVCPMHLYQAQCFPQMSFIVHRQRFYRSSIQIIYQIWTARKMYCEHHVIDIHSHSIYL